MSTYRDPAGCIILFLDSCTADEQHGPDPPRQRRQGRVSEGVFVVGRLHGTVPGPVELLQHILSGRPAGLDDPVERFKIT